MTKDTQSTLALEAFIRRFEDTYYGDLAKVRFTELEQAETAKKKVDDDARANEESERKRIALSQQEEEKKRVAALAAAAKEDRKAKIAALAPATEAAPPPLPKPASVDKTALSRVLSRTAPSREERAACQGDRGEQGWQGAHVLEHERDVRPPMCRPSVRPRSTHVLSSRRFVHLISAPDLPSAWFHAPVLHAHH